MLHPGIPPVGADRSFVGHHLDEVDTQVGKVVDSRGDLRPDCRSSRLVPSVGATVVISNYLESQNGAVLLYWDFHIETALVSVVCEHVFPPILGPLYRTSGFHGKQADQGDVRIADDFCPKTPTDISGDHSDFVRGESQPEGEPRDAEHRHLVVAVNIQKTVSAVIIHNDSIVFDRGRTEPVKMQPASDYFISFAEASVNITVIPRSVKDLICTHLLMDQRHAIPNSFSCVKRVVRRFVVHFDIF